MKQGSKNKLKIKYKKLVSAIPVGLYEKAVSACSTDVYFISFFVYSKSEYTLKSVSVQPD